MSKKFFILASSFKKMKINQDPLLVGGGHMQRQCRNKNNDFILKIKGIQAIQDGS